MVNKRAGGLRPPCASVTLRLPLNGQVIRTRPYSSALRKEWVGAGRAKPSRPEVDAGLYLSAAHRPPACKMSIVNAPRVLVGPRDAWQQLSRMKWELVVGSGDDRYHVYIGVPKFICQASMGIAAVKAASLEDMRKPWDDETTVMDELLSRVAEVMDQRDDTPTRVKIYYKYDRKFRVDYGPQSPQVWMGSDARGPTRQANEIERRFCDYCFATLPQYDVTVRRAQRSGGGLRGRFTRWAGLEGPTVPLDVKMLTVDSAMRSPTPTWKGATTAAVDDDGLISLQDAMNDRMFSATRGGTMTITHGTTDNLAYLTGTFAGATYETFETRYDGVGSGVVCCGIVELTDERNNVCATVIVPIHQSTHDTGPERHASFVINLVDAEGNLTRAHSVLDVSFRMEAEGSRASSRAKVRSGEPAWEGIVGGVALIGIGAGIFTRCPIKGIIIMIIGRAVYLASTGEGK